MISGSGRGALVCVATLLCSGAAWAADPTPARGPRPAWVTETNIPAADPARKDDLAQFLLLASQTHLSSASLEHYFEYAIVPQTVAGLQGAGTVALPWNAARADMTIHSVEIRRGNQVIDLLPGAEFTVLRRENNLEHAKLDGLRTVVLPAKGLQTGDILHVSASYRMKADTVGSHRDHSFKLEPPIRVGLMQSRVVVDPGVDVAWRAAPLIAKPTVTATPAGTIYLFSMSNVEPRKFPNAMLPEEKEADIQFTRYKNWNEVAESLQPLFAAARKIEPESPLAKEADRIAAENKEPLGQMLAALRLSQEQVRYVALLLGEGAYVPVSAEETWSQKFGDCKGKSAMLLALLDRLGIAAEPLMVKASSGELLGERLPSLQAFDHVIVRATIDGQHYYLDATDYGQRTATEVQGSSLHWGLLLTKGAKLEKLPPVPADRPLRESELNWDASAGITGDIPFTAKVTLRSTAAAAARVKRAAASDKEEIDTLLKGFLPGVANEDLEIVDWTETDAAGDLVINFKGKASLDWDQYEGMKGYRFSFNKDAVFWDPDFDRDDGPFKDAPVLIGDSYWQREIETVLLPKGGKGFSVDATTIAETVAGTRFERSVVMKDGRATSIGEFHHLAHSISADEARKAKNRLDEINEDFAYLVAPRGFKPPKPRD